MINKHSNIQLDINFIKSCKREDLVPTFAKVNVAIKHGTQKLKMKIARAVIAVIARAVIETEMQNKHQERKIKKRIRDIKFQLKSSLTFIVYNTLLHRINVAVKSRVKVITTRRLNKLSNLRNKRSAYSSNSHHMLFIKKHCL